MKQFIQNSSGKLQLSEGISHILGYRVRGFQAAGKGEFSEGLGEYVLDGSTSQILAGDALKVTLEDPPISKESLQTIGIQEGGVLISLRRDQSTYYIKPSSIEAVEGLV